MANFNQRTIESFKNKLRGGGARSNLFEVTFDGPNSGANGGTPSGAVLDRIGITFDEGDLMLIKAASLPASTITEIPVPFRGRTLKIAGDRTFDVWTITVINDTDFKWRSFFERWMNLITKVSDGSGATLTSDYMVDMSVSQLSRGPIGSLDIRGDQNNTAIEVLRKYTVHGAFPTNVSTIDLSYNNENEIEEFTVDLQVQWVTAENGRTSPIGPVPVY